jgi:hypothetical protein
MAYNAHLYWMSYAHQETYMQYDIGTGLLLMLNDLRSFIWYILIKIS